MAGWKRVFRSEFVPEWSALALLVLADALWARTIGFHVAIAGRDFLVLYWAFGIIAALKFFDIRRGALMAEYFALTLAATSVICVLSYLALASSGPLVDARLMAMDRALGFDWLASYRFVMAHPLLSKVLGFAYGSLCYQGLYFCVLLAVMNAQSRLREMFWLVLICGLLACMGALWLPAFGPSKLYNIGTTNGFMPDMMHLVSKQKLDFTLAKMTGVVSFPSFHTAMALAYAYAFRKTGIVGWAIAGLNLVMLAAVPWFGGHYLVDMIAGAATMLLALGLINGFARLRVSAGYASPKSAAAYADAYSTGAPSR